MLHAIAAEVSRPWEITAVVVAGYITVVAVVVTVMARHAAPEPYRCAPASHPPTVPGQVIPEPPARDLETAWAVPEEEIDALIELCLEWGEPGG